MGNQASTAAPVTKLFPALRATLPSMKNKTVAITGCTSGTGLVLARTCGELGARVIMLNRPSSRADAALKLLVDAKISAELVPIDLQSFASVHECSKLLQQTCPDGIDVLCNNAGVMGILDEATADGFDVQMQSNHLSHFLLTAQIWPLLQLAAAQRGEARVVNHSSGARNKPGKPIVDPEYLGANGGRLGGDGFPGLGKWRRYQQSKLANLMFTYALHDKAREAGDSTIKVLCAHPGPTATGLQGKTTTAGGDRYLDRYILSRAVASAQSIEDGAMGIVRACCETEVQSSEFYGPSVPGSGGAADLLPPERNADNERILWDESLRSTGLASFF